MFRIDCGRWEVPTINDDDDDDDDDDDYDVFSSSQRIIAPSHVINLNICISIYISTILIVDFIFRCNCFWMLEPMFRLTNDYNSFKLNNLKKQYTFGMADFLVHFVNMFYFI